MLMKEIKDATNTWRDIPYSWIRKIKLWKWLHYPKQSTDSVQSLLNYQWHFFHRIKTKNFTICKETQKTLNSQSNLEKEKWIWRNKAPWLYYKAIVINNVCAGTNTVEQSRKSRDKPTCLWSLNLQQRKQDYTMEKRHPLQ